MELTATPTTSPTFPNSSDYANASRSSRPAPPHTQAAAVAIILVVSIIILVTIVGNALVVVAVFTSRALRAPQNLFLVSLASADILVATLVIPFSLANEVMGYWYFGRAWCSFYLALDVLFCTSSIAHLCAISLDRYWSVTKAVSYNLKRTPKRIKSMIAGVWLVSTVVSFPPLLMTDEGAGDAGECLLNNETWYILSSCVASFFAPGLVMILVYCKIYRVAKLRASTIFAAKSGMERQPSHSETCFTPRGRFPNDAPSPLSGRRQDDGELDAIDLEESCSAPPDRLHFPKRGKVEGAEARRNQSCRLSWASHRPTELLAEPDPRPKMRSASKTKLAQVREKRFTFVLAVVMGVFVLCWFPFFFTYSLHAVCRERCVIPQGLFNLFFWIGYCNSSLNPVIYTIFNRDFRRAFKKIVFQNHPRNPT